MCRVTRFDRRCSKAGEQIGHNCTTKNAGGTERGEYHRLLSIKIIDARADQFLCISKAHIRFHIETLLGRSDPESSLPAPATAADKQTWMKGIAFDEINVDLDELSRQSSQDNSKFPYKDGPGHKDSSPQQLSIMWKTMNAVGLKSFRPDFSLPKSDPDNKWLWELAYKIFIELVECGEYPGVSLELENRLLIRRCFDTHVKSLSKRHVHTYSPANLSHSYFCTSFIADFVKKRWIPNKKTPLQRMPEEAQDTVK